MGKDAAKSLHRNIQEQFDIMRDLIEEIRRLKEKGDSESLSQASRLADILDKLSDKAYRMNEIVREAA